MLSLESTKVGDVYLDASGALYTCRFKGKYQGCFSCPSGGVYLMTLVSGVCDEDDTYSLVEKVY